MEDLWIEEFDIPIISVCHGRARTARENRHAKIEISPHWENIWSQLPQGKSQVLHKYEGLQNISTNTTGNYRSTKQLLQVNIQDKPNYICQHYIGHTLLCHLLLVLITRVEG